MSIPWFLAWAVLGVGYAVDYVVTFEWHHGTIVPAFALIVGGLSSWGLYRTAAARVRARRWLSADDETARRGLERMREDARDLPPWTRRRYLARRADLRDGRDATWRVHPHERETTRRCH